MTRSTPTPRRANQASARSRKAMALSFFSSGRRAGDAVAEAVDAAELFGVDVHQFARPLAFIAHHRRRRVERREAAEPEPAQHRANGRARQAEFPGDPLAGQTLSAQPLDLGVARVRGAV